MRFEPISSEKQNCDPTQDQGANIEPRRIASKAVIKFAEDKGTGHLLFRRGRLNAAQIAAASAASFFCR